MGTSPWSNPPTAACKSNDKSGPAMEIELIEGLMSQDNASPGFRSQKGKRKKGQETSTAKGSIPKRSSEAFNQGYIREAM